MKGTFVSGWSEAAFIEDARDGPPCVICLIGVVRHGFG